MSASGAEAEVPATDFNFRFWKKEEISVGRPLISENGSKADVTLLNFDVRFYPESGHSPTRSGCLLWAKRRQSRRYTRLGQLG
jgi:hypothetical protein